jgi:hypothetical protein
MTKRAIAWTLAALLTSGASTFAAGCGGDATAPQHTPVGVYQLRTINDVPVPVVISSGTPTRTVLDDQYTLSADDTYSEQGTLQTGSGSSATSTPEVETGTWTLLNVGVVFVPTNDSIDSYTGLLSGDTLTVTSGSSTAVYVKQ